MTQTTAFNTPTINLDRFETACQIVEQARDGLVNVLLTGKGEPLLYPKMITQYLDHLNYRFPLVDLQTNGILLKHDLLKRWGDMGLGVVCISIAHYLPQTSNTLMGIEAGFNFYDTIDCIHKTGLSVRLNCTMLKSGVHTFEHALKLIEHCQSFGVEQLTLREVEIPDVIKSTPQAERVREYVQSVKPHGSSEAIRGQLEVNGAVPLLHLPHGAIIYDYKGQNVCLNNCLTSTTDPNDIRQIIFFPNGQITYSWEYPGARLL